MAKFSDLKRQLADFGIRIGGAFADDRSRKGLLLINHDGRFWDAFKRSSQHTDGNADPMDRWCVEILDDISYRFSCDWVHPSQRPFHPFQAWACQLPKVSASPLGLLIHEEFGLHWGMRGALFPTCVQMIKQVELMLDEQRSCEGPCENCEEKPCLNACPVGAHGKDGFAVSNCKTYLADNHDSQCMQSGCLARNACPVASVGNIPIAQRQFHMRAFRG